MPTLQWAFLHQLFDERIRFSKLPKTDLSTFQGIKVNTDRHRSNNNKSVLAWVLALDFTPAWLSWKNPQRLWLLCVAAGSCKTLNTFCPCRRPTAVGLKYNIAKRTFLQGLLPCTLASCVRKSPVRIKDVFLCQSGSVIKSPSCTMGYSTYDVQRKCDYGYF